MIWGSGLVTKVKTVSSTFSSDSAGVEKDFLFSVFHLQGFHQKVENSGPVAMGGDSGLWRDYCSGNTDIPAEKEKRTSDITRLDADIITQV